MTWRRNEKKNEQARVSETDWEPNKCVTPTKIIHIFIFIYLRYVAVQMSNTSKAPIQYHVCKLIWNVLSLFTLYTTYSYILWTKTKYLEITNG